MKKISKIYDFIRSYNRYRELFAQERESKDISDDHLMMIDVHNTMDVSFFQVMCMLTMCKDIQVCSRDRKGSQDASRF
jgi:hypothetical protein